MTEPKWIGPVLYNSNFVLGWIGYDSTSQFWYARTSGTNTHAPVRGSFDTEQSARDFLQFITSVETQ